MFYERPQGHSMPEHMHIDIAPYQLLGVSAALDLWQGCRQGAMYMSEQGHQQDMPYCVTTWQHWLHPASRGACIEESVHGRLVKQGPEGHPTLSDHCDQYTSDNTEANHNHKGFTQRRHYSRTFNSRHERRIFGGQSGHQELVRLHAE